MEIPCRKCLPFADHYQKLEEIIADYINTLEEDLRADQKLYEARLLKCEHCEALLNGICKYCGCFVLARASKSSQTCPYPLLSKW